MSENPYQENPFKVPSIPPKPMGLWQILTSFEGRIPRSTFCFWVFALAFVDMTVIFVVFNTALKILHDPYPHKGIYPIIIYAVQFPLVYCLSAICAKRWHDHDKSALWSAIIFLPLGIGFLWLFIECGLVAGTPGRNRYGENPLR